MGRNNEANRMEAAGMGGGGGRRDGIRTMAIVSAPEI